jgi:hypothetical protein
MEKVIIRIFIGVCLAFWCGAAAVAGTCTVSSSSVANTNAISAARANNRWFVLGNCCAGSINYSGVAAVPPLRFSSVGFTSNANVTESDVAYGNGVYVAVGSAQNYIGAYANDSDMTNWTLIPYNGTRYKSRIHYGLGYFVTQYDYNTSSNKLMVSTNGATWSQATLPASAKWRGLAFDGTKFVALSTDGKIAYSTAPASAWTSGGGVPVNANTCGDWYDLEYCGGYFYTIGAKGCVIRSASGTGNWGNIYDIGQGVRTTGNGRLRCDAATGRLLATRTVSNTNNGFHIMKENDITQWDYVAANLGWFRNGTVHNNYLVTGGSGSSSYYSNLNNCSFAWFAPNIVPRPDSPCAAGEYKANGTCECVGSGYYSPDGDNSRYACPGGTKSCGCSHAEFQSDCTPYRLLKINAATNQYPNGILMQTIKRVSPSLALNDGTGNTYYAGLKPSGSTGLSGLIQIMFGGTKYSVYSQCVK